MSPPSREILCYKCGGIMTEDPVYPRVYCQYCGRVLIQSPAGTGRLIVARDGEMPTL